MKQLRSVRQPREKSQESFPEASVDDILIANVFKVLVPTLDLLGKAEEQLMRGRLGQLINASQVNDVEEMVETLYQKVVTVVMTRKMVGLNLKADLEIGFLQLRPQLLRYFLGPQVSCRKSRKCYASMHAWR